MANSNGWGDGSVNNNIGWGQGSNNAVGWGKSHLDSWAGDTDIDGGNLPSNSVAPAITGTAQEGQTLTCSTGTWSGSPTYTYQWKRNGSNIGSATNSTYTLVTADVGQSIKCTVTATNFVGSATADSNTVTPTSSVDADAQAFITAASITNPTQQSAINQLVVDLKGYNIWTKMKALYPFVGGTAAQHKWNLKDPRDLDAAFRLVFSGGWTHSANGAAPNGTNGYADTFFNPNTSASLNSHSLSYYSRTNATNAAIEIGVGNNDTGIYNIIELRTTNTTYFGINSTLASYADSDSRGFYLANRQASNDLDLWKQGVKVVNGTTASNTLLNKKIYLGAMSSLSGADPQFYSTKQCAFASIGDGLTDTDAANLYTSVQAFQTTLGRSIGTQTVSDADAQAFVTNAGIVDQVEANAVNNLVIGLKADSLWTKSYVLYPFVGGTASTHKFNLKNPLDTNAAFRLLFGGGITHSTNGVQFGGVNGWAETYFNPLTQSITKSNFGVSVYSRSNTNGYKSDIGAVDSGSYVWLVPRYSASLDFAGSYDDSNFNGNYLTNTLGLISVVRDSATTQKFYQGGVQKGTRTGFNATADINQSFYVGARNNVGVPANFTDRQLAFVAIHEGFNATEIANFNTRIQTFQTALNRNV